MTNISEIVLEKLAKYGSTAIPDMAGVGNWLPYTPSHLNVTVEKLFSSVTAATTTTLYEAPTSASISASTPSCPAFLPTSFFGGMAVMAVLAWVYPYGNFGKGFVRKSLLKAETKLISAVFSFCFP